MKRMMFRTGLGAALALILACGDDRVFDPTTHQTLVGSGVIASESRPVSGFTAVTVSGPLRLVLQQVGVESLEVTADDNVLRVVESEGRGGRLFLGFAPNTSLTRVHEVVCRVTMREVRDIEASGASRLEISGVDTNRLGILLSGATLGSASGTVENLTVAVSGASRWTAGALRSRSVTATVSGASYGLVRAEESLVASVSGASMLEYLGDPRVNAAVDGVSTVRRIGPWGDGPLPR